MSDAFVGAAVALIGFVVGFLTGAGITVLLAVWWTE